MVGSFATPTVQLRNPGAHGDPLYAVWASTHAADVDVRSATAADQRFITDMQYAAFFVPPGGVPFDREILDDPDIRKYHADFGTVAGDVGRIAVDRSGEAVGAAWVRRVRGYGFVDDRTPELGVAVVDGRRGAGVGSALLDSLLIAVPRVSLSVDERNPALHLYERLGFEVVRRDGEHTLVMLRDRAGRSAR